MTRAAKTRAAMTIAVAASLIWAAGSALAQTTVTRSATAAPGKAVRIGISPNLKKDCSPGPLPEIRVIAAPKNGSLITRAGKVKTPASYRCPNVEANVQAVFYQSNPRYSGADEAIFEIKSPEGAVERITVKITVTAKPATPKPSETTDL